MYEAFDTLVAERPVGAATEGQVELTELLRVLVGSAGHAMATAALVAVDGMDADTLRQVVIGVEQLRRFLDATQAHALAELVDRDVTDRACGASTSAWLARSTAIPSGVARQRAFLDRLAEAEAFSGTALLARDGRVVFEAARGIADRNHGVPMRLDSKLNLGSMDKMFTAVVIGQLVDEGKLSFQDPVSKFLGGKGWTKVGFEQIAAWNAPAKTSRPS